MATSCVHMMGSLALSISCLIIINAIAAAGEQRRLLQAETVFDITKYGAKGDGTTDDAMVNFHPQMHENENEMKLYLFILYNNECHL